jgi:hypothetical protein
MSTRVSSGPSIPRDRGRTSVSLTLEFGHAKASSRLQRLPGPDSTVVANAQANVTSSAALRNLQPPQFPSDTFRILAVAGPFPTLASSLGRDDKA